MSNRNLIDEINTNVLSLITKIDDLINKLNEKQSNNAPVNLGAVQPTAGIPAQVYFGQDRAVANAIGSPGSANVLTSDDDKKAEEEKEKENVFTKPAFRIP